MTLDVLLRQVEILSTIVNTDSSETVAVIKSDKTKELIQKAFDLGVSKGQEMMLNLVNKLSK